MFYNARIRIFISPLFGVRGKGTIMKYRLLLIAFAIAISLAVLGTVNHAMAAKQCDHKCLVDLMQKYVNALPKHDPTGLPFDKQIKFTENNDKTVDVLEVGKGMWENASSGPTEFQIYGADPKAQAAACLVVMKEKDKDVLLGARIKLNKDGKIMEAEHLVVRSGMSSKPFSSMETLQKARPGFGEDIPKAEQMKREDLIKIGYSYYDALTSEDGTRAPFAKECQRRENGNISAGGPPRKAAPGGMTGFGGNAPTDCEGQLSAGVFSYITEIKPRIVVADVEKGLSIGFSMFRHDRTKRLPKDAPPGTSNATQWYFNMPAMHIFKIRNGKIYEIEAPGATLPYGIKSGWESEEKVYPIPK
jgi:hypothetical protein